MVGAGPYSDLTSAGADAYSTSSLIKFGALPYTLLLARDCGVGSVYWLGNLVARLRDQTMAPTMAKMSSKPATPPATPAINAMSSPLSSCCGVSIFSDAPLVGAFGRDGVMGGGRGSAESPVVGTADMGDVLPIGFTGILVVAVVVDAIEVVGPEAGVLVIVVVVGAFVVVGGVVGG